MRSFQRRSRRATGNLAKGRESRNPLPGKSSSVRMLRHLCRRDVSLQDSVKPVWLGFWLASASDRSTKSSTLSFPTRSEERRGIGRTIARVHVAAGEIFLHQDIEPHIFEACLP